MGTRGLESPNILSCLVSQGEPPPNLTYEAIYVFVRDILEGEGLRLLTHPSDSPDEIRNWATWVAQAYNLRQKCSGKPAPADAADVHRIFRPLLRILRSYDLVVVPVGSWQDVRELEQMASEAASAPGILVALPAEFYGADDSVRVHDPDEGVEVAVKRRDLWPGVIVGMRTGRSVFIPGDTAHKSLHDMVQWMQISQERPDVKQDKFSIQWRIMVQNAAARDGNVRRRILHLSDLHFGREDVSKRQSYLVAALSGELERADEVVITGDLFDQPWKRHAREYKTFANTLRTICRRPPIWVPGNHDQRLFGNNIFARGRLLRELAGLHFQAFADNPRARMAFFCFDSCRSGILARGKVDDDQLYEMAMEYEHADNEGRLDGYLKVALVHHHPYEPDASPGVETLIDPRTWIGREEFVGFDGREEFRNWCAARGIGLILHGHLHTPRLIEDSIPVDTGRGTDERRLMTVGCGSSLGIRQTPMFFDIIEWSPESQSWTVEFFKDQRGGGFLPLVVEATPRISEHHPTRGRHHH
ncbi:hypothetical protein SLUN_19410 [Streptomyces lunaelactis]|uniref:Calcineurin-like phosphoesterase domain-containing protein n=1 Tax=Streptomyces lunaelactis TaxID=1535768 RepID=A0A2R4T4E6_9ACTN|nr:hypothetical protein SLUN_19410 [Streptomyces lunaelactis]